MRRRKGAEIISEHGNHGIDETLVSFVHSVFVKRNAPRFCVFAFVFLGRLDIFL
jgi:hypothetical protein